MPKQKSGGKLRRSAKHAAMYKAQFLRTARNKARRAAKKPGPSSGVSPLKAHQLANRERRITRRLGGLVKRIEDAFRSNREDKAQFLAWLQTERNTLAARLAELTRP